MNCLNQTVVLFSALSTYGWGARRVRVSIYRPQWLVARFRSSSPLGARGVIQDLLSPLLAPFGVHAQRKQARNRLETVWSLSEFDKIEDGVLHVFADLQRRRQLEMGIFALLPKRLRSWVAILSQNIFLHKRCESFFSCSLSADSSLCSGR